MSASTAAGNLAVAIRVAIVFNPFVKVHLSKELWAIVDVAARLLLQATSKHIKSRGSEGT
jgi:hypothetical protein